MTLLWEAVLAILVAAVVFAATVRLESTMADRQQTQADRMAASAEILENVRFVRDVTSSGSRRTFAGMQLAGADLSGLDLGCDVGESKTQVEARLARLKDKARNCADFAAADLRDARFLGTTLAGADLSRAKLRGARFIRTDLRGVDLTGASPEGAVFEAVCHGPSTVWPTGFEAPAVSEPTCRERSDDVLIARLLLSERMAARAEQVRLLRRLQKLRHDAAMDVIDDLR
ncbi:hypothetical protein J2X46_004137 [Nocardioides sp. BE266]|uniref:pentapeptide repeat-containing protein n=1 Tax=Nocardioides sp. BE266 TaxID=2817725 RepID=UPI0028595A6B|nr:pentapeptide repeat-containing protein [Nocardioides sp. BE266]MDR7255135.1 hypothetical protein [Nocardioides sp. BE266]